MALPCSYGFTGTENPLATNWSTGPFTGQVMKEGSGAAIAGTAGSLDCGSYWDADAFDADQWGQATCLTEYTGISLRIAGDDGYMVFYRDADRTRISRVDNAATTIILTATGQSNAANDVMYAEIVGDTITAQLGDSAEITVDDATYASGSVGIYALSQDTTTGRLDDFSAGNMVAGASTALTGTITTATEVDIRTGGKTIVLTLTGDTWVADGATFNAQRQNIIDGIDSAQSEALGWDAEVKAKIPVTGVVRTSDTICTITLSAQAGYRITANETITAIVPGSALTAGNPLTASPTFVVAIAKTAELSGTALASIKESDIVTGGKTIIITLYNDTFIPST